MARVCGLSGGLQLPLGRTVLLPPAYVRRTRPTPLLEPPRHLSVPPTDRLVLIALGAFSLPTARHAGVPPSPQKVQFSPLTRCTHLWEAGYRAPFRRVGSGGSLTTCGSDKRGFCHALIAFCGFYVHSAPWQLQNHSWFKQNPQSIIGFSRWCSQGAWGTSPRLKRSESITCSRGSRDPRQS